MDSLSCHKTKRTETLQYVASREVAFARPETYSNPAIDFPKESKIRFECI